MLLGAISKITSTMNRIGELTTLLLWMTALSRVVAQDPPRLQLLYTDQQTMLRVAPVPDIRWMWQQIPRVLRPALVVWDGQNKNVSEPLLTVNPSANNTPVAKVFQTLSGSAGVMCSVTPLCIPSCSEDITLSLKRPWDTAAYSVLFVSKNSTWAPLPSTPLALVSWSNGARVGRARSLLSALC